MCSHCVRILKAMKKTNLSYSENITTDGRILKIKYLGKFKSIERSNSRKDQTIETPSLKMVM